MASREQQPWTEERVRVECKMGTAAQAEAYGLSGFPAIEEHYRKVRGIVIDTNTRPPAIKQYVRKKPQPLALCVPLDQLIHDSCIAHREYTHRDIAKMICARYGVTLTQITSRVRTKSLVAARREIFYLCYKYLDMSLSEIGRAFKKHHTTVLHGLRMLKQDLKRQGKNA